MGLEWTNLRRCGLNLHPETSSRNVYTTWLDSADFAESGLTPWSSSAKLSSKSAQVVVNSAQSWPTRIKLWAELIPNLTSGRTQTKPQHGIATKTMWRAIPTGHSHKGRARAVGGRGPRPTRRSRRRIAAAPRRRRAAATPGGRRPPAPRAPGSSPRCRRPRGGSRASPPQARARNGGEPTPHQHRSIDPKLDPDSTLDLLTGGVRSTRWPPKEAGAKERAGFIRRPSPPPSPSPACASSTVLTAREANSGQTRTKFGRVRSMLTDPNQIMAEVKSVSPCIAQIWPISGQIRPKPAKLKTSSPTQLKKCSDVSAGTGREVDPSCSRGFARELAKHTFRQFRSAAMDLSKSPRCRRQLAQLTPNWPTPRQNLTMFRLTPIEIARGLAEL